MSANGMFPAMDACGPAVSRFVHLLSTKRVATVTVESASANLDSWEAVRAESQASYRCELLSLCRANNFHVDILFRVRVGAK